MDTPEKLDRGPKWLADKINEILAFAAAIRPLRTPTCEVHETASGTLILPKQGGGGGGGGSSSDLQPFQLVSTMSDGATPTPMIRVVSSTLAGGSSADLGFALGDEPPYLLAPSAGVLIGGITFGPTTGLIATRWLEIQAIFPDPSGVPDGTDYVEIGTVAWDAANEVWTVSNSRYGPINITICRNWFAAEAPFYSVTWS